MIILMLITIHEHNLWCFPLDHHEKKIARLSPWGLCALKCCGEDRFKDSQDWGWTAGCGVYQMALSGLYWLIYIYIHHHWIVSQLYSDYLLLIWINIDKSIYIISQYISICTTNLGHVIWLCYGSKLKTWMTTDLSLCLVLTLQSLRYPILTHSNI